jgi:superfamily I DNA and/or RNA helicase
MKKYQATTEEIKKVESSLLTEVKELSELRVDSSILKATGIAKLVTTVVKKYKKENTSESLPSFVTKADHLLDSWRTLVREQTNDETIKNLKGGKIIKTPSFNEITEPSGLSSKLWNSFCLRYNESQLFAIKYVINQFDYKKDTRIALIQGPPGTGKTSTIIGIISAILNHAGFTSSSSTNASTSTFAASITSVSSAQRLLICAPSNAAIDEILTRLTLNGIYDQDGLLITNQLKIVRLGEPPSSSSGSIGTFSPLIHSLTLEYQVEQKILVDELYQRFLTITTSIEEVENQTFEKQSKLRELKAKNSTNTSLMKSLENALSSLKLQLYELRNTKQLYEISIDKKKQEIRTSLLLEANVVGTTLSSSGKQHFLDYIIKENVFFTTTIIDEAAQTTEPSTLIPLRFGCRRLVLVGDPRQLPATVLSRKADKFGLGRSLFERLEKAEHEVVMLTIQYRMHPGKAILSCLSSSVPFFACFIFNRNSIISFTIFLSKSVS